MPKTSHSPIPNGKPHLHMSGKSIQEFFCRKLGEAWAAVMEIFTFQPFSQQSQPRRHVVFVKIFFYRNIFRWFRNPANQLRYGTYPVIHTVSYMLGGCLGFLRYSQYVAASASHSVVDQPACLYVRRSELGLNYLLLLGVLRKSLLHLAMDNLP